MNNPSQQPTTQTPPRRRNWLLTIAAIPFLALFTYIAVGIWLVDAEGNALSEVYVKVIISLVAAWGVFLNARVIVRGHTKRGFGETLSSIIAAGS